jgi:hypothetical protein
MSARTGPCGGCRATGIPTAITSKTKAFSFTHRTKVFADGTVRKNNA